MAINTDSYTLYREIIIRYKKNAPLDKKEEKFRDADALVSCILQEILASPSGVENSTFLRNAYEAFCVDEKASLSTVSEYPDTFKSDVGLIARTLCDKVAQLQNPANNMVASLNRISLFTMPITADEANARHYLEHLRGLVVTYATKRSSSLETNARAQPQPIMQENTAKSAAPSPRDVQRKAAPQITEVSEPEKRELEPTLKKPYDREQARHEWHERQSDVLRKIAEIQPQISESLKTLMSFPKEIVEEYVRRFAETQIDLFNNIAEQYRYHHERAENPRQPDDYKNAVENYADFMDMICDALSEFGIEEICTAPGSPFQASVHEPAHTIGFAAAQSNRLVVDESLRSGFRYNELILQKERVTLSNPGNYQYAGGHGK